MYCHIAIVVILLFFCSCSSRVSRCESQVESYRHGELVCADEKDFPVGAYTKNRESARLLLDRGVIRLQQGDAEGSLSDLRTAIDAIDYYRSVLPQETAVQLLTSDEQSAYVAKKYEALFARLFAAFACYELKETDNAFAFLKQALAQEDLRNEQEGRKERSPLLSYLMALHLERQRDLSQAAFFYRRAFEACPLKFIEEDIARVSACGAGTNATVLVIVHQGVIPEKESIVAPVSIVSAAALEVLLAGLDIPPAISSLTGIAIPAFPERRSLPRPPSVTVGKNKYAPEKVEDVFSLAKQELDEEIPKLAAQAAARQLIRRAAVGALREQNPLIGDIADIFAFAGNLLTKADTRMCKALPRDIYLFRIDLPAGTYRVGSSHVTLQSGELYVHQHFHPQT